MGASKSTDNCIGNEVFGPFQSKVPFQKFLLFNFMFGGPLMNIHQKSLEQKAFPRNNLRMHYDFLFLNAGNSKKFSHLEATKDYSEANLNDSHTHSAQISKEMCVRQRSLSCVQQSGAEEQVLCSNIVTPNSTPREGAAMLQHRV